MIISNVGNLCGKGLIQFVHYLSNSYWHSYSPFKASSVDIISDTFLCTGEHHGTKFCYHISQWGLLPLIMDIFMMHLLNTKRQVGFEIKPPRLQFLDKF